MTQHKNGDKISVKAVSGRTYEYVWKDSPNAGAMKIVYFSPDKSYVVAFFKDPQDANAIDRLQNLVGTYRQGIFGGVGGDYWKRIYCWPSDLIRDGNRIGIVVPAYHPEFFFKHDGPTLKMKGLEKEGKWYTSPEHHFRNLSDQEIGNWHSFFDVCLLLARGVRRMHNAGLAHSDLSYKNVLIDPVTPSAAIIDIDGLVVPGKYPPDVIGTPDFIAPEVYETMSLPKGDPNRKLPSQDTDRHALAVLIYMYLLYRHPLRGRQICDIDDPQKDEQLSMGAKAVFIEDPSNTCNRYDVNWVHDNYPKSKWPFILPWMDLGKLPYTICGPYLKALFDRAFIKGLHAPSARPAAFEWEQGIVDTMDLMIPCQNKRCRQKWFVFDNSASRPRCPFCGATYDIPLPVLNLYNRAGTSYKPTNRRVMVYNGTRLYQWHTNPRIARNEKLTADQKMSVACFQFHQGKWYLRNERAAGMTDLQTKKPIPVGSVTELKDGVQIRLGDDQSRMIYVQMVNKQGE